MAFVATLLYIALALISPWEAYPELASLRIMVWLMLIIGLVTVGQILSGKVALGLPQIPLLIVFLMLTMLSIAVTGWMGGMIPVITQLMVPMAAFGAVMTSVESPSRIRWICRILMLVAVYLAIRGMLAVLFGLDLDTYAIAENVADQDFEGLNTIYRARAVNFLADPNDFAQFLVACIPLTALLWRSRSLLLNFFQVMMPIGIMLGAIYLTRSRGGLIGLAFLVALAAARLSKFAAPLVGIGVIVGMLALGFSGGREASLGGGTGAGRIDLWAEAIMVARAHPILGVGYGNILDHLELTAHNSYLLCLTEIGVPGLFFWLASFSFAMFQLWPMLTHPDLSAETRRYCRLALGSLVSVMITSFFLSRTYSLTLYLSLGIAVGVLLTARKELPTDPPPLFRIKWFFWNGGMMVAVLAVAYVMVRLRRF